MKYHAVLNNVNIQVFFLHIGVTYLCVNNMSALEVICGVTYTFVHVWPSNLVLRVKSENSQSSASWLHPCVSESVLATVAGEEAGEMLFSLRS